MRLTAERDALAKALKLAASAVSNKGSLPVLSGVRIDARKGHATFCCTDLELTVETDVQADIEAGVAVVPAKLLVNVVSSLAPGAATIEVDERGCTVTCGDTKADLIGTLPAETWPRVPKPDGPVAELSSAQAEVIRAILPFAGAEGGNDTWRVAVRFGGDEVAVCDGFRLGVAHVHAELPEILLPAATLGPVLATVDDSGCTLTVAQDGQAATITPAAGAFTLRSMTGSYPNYRALLRPESPSEWTFDTEALVEAVKRVCIVARDPGTDPVRITVEGDKAVVECTTTDVGAVSDVVTVEASGPDIGMVAFNNRYLLALLQSADTEHVTFGLMDHVKPALLKVVDLELLLMPVRVKQP